MSALLQAINAFMQAYPGTSVAIIAGILGFFLTIDIGIKWGRQ